MIHADTGRASWLLLMTLVLSTLGMGALVRIAANHYRAVMREFEPGPYSPALDHPDQTGLADLKAIRFVTRDSVEIAGWYIPSHNRAAVILTHGTGADRSSMLPEMRALAASGFGVLAFDWPGSGKSGGGIHWNQMERNALIAAADWLGTRAEMDQHRIGVLGFSFGGYVTAQVVPVDARFRAVVLVATPPSLDAYISNAHDKWGPISRWPADLALWRAGVRNADSAPERTIAKVAPRAILFIAGESDPIVRPDMVQQLFTAARQPKELWIVPGAQHGDYAQSAGTQYGERLVRFFSERLLH